MTKRKALGKGLSALIPDANRIEGDQPSFFHCPVHAIEPNPAQPRKTFDHPEFDELVASVREKGVLTPLLVSRTRSGYRLIAGERRWRAAQRAGVKTVPVVVRETTPAEALELALVENIHRKDLNPIEEAEAYRQCLEDGRLTQETLARRLGKDRTTITNMLRLLTLPPYIQEDLLEQRLSMGHARVIAGLKTARDQKTLRDLVLKKGLTVRQAEETARRLSSPRPAKPPAEEDETLLALADNLKRSLGTKVEIQKRGRRGRITIHFYSDDELERLLDRLG
ncbi:MAG: ParB/RepB/Spo0J family partition protein [Deltaproteobacteria bacterium]|nr:ParB/RepB/Spo0J family partition protein [Deltaproteobacteria bacterium]